MIDRFHVQNYKALREVDLTLTPIHVLIGPNDSGKTSILEAVAALSRSVEMPLADAFAGPWEGRELVWNGEDVPVKMEAVGTDVQYALSVRFSPDGRRANVDAERIAATPAPLAGSLTAVCAVVREQLQADDAQRAAAMAVHDMLHGVHFYRWIPQLLAVPCAPDASRKFRMDVSGFGLALCLDEILGVDRHRFTTLEERFKQIFPQIHAIRLQQEPAYRSAADPKREFPILQPADGKGLYFEMTTRGALVPASQVSDGLLLVLAYLTVLYLPQPPRLLLVEEPENGIHPGRLREVMTILRELVAEQGHTQVVMTTHSPYVVDLFKPEEVTLCHKGDDGAVKVTRLSESEKVRQQVDIFTLGEIWTGEGDEALAAPAGQGE